LFEIAITLLKKTKINNNTPFKINKILNDEIERDIF
jgi:hypothetical protein